MFFPRTYSLSCIALLNECRGYYETLKFCSFYPNKPNLVFHPAPRHYATKKYQLFIISTICLTEGAVPRCTNRRLCISAPIRALLRRPSPVLGRDTSETADSLRRYLFSISVTNCMAPPSLPDPFFLLILFNVQSCAIL